MTNRMREGEERLPYDPAECADGPTLYPIGTLYSDWDGDAPPKNLRQARERGGGNGRIVLRPEMRAGLKGLEAGQAIWLILWFDRARRDLIVQAPRHVDGSRGTFALRSPVRPNPISIAIARIIALNDQTGEIHIDVTDALNGTPVLDIKPWIETIDLPADPD